MRFKLTEFDSAICKYRKIDAEVFFVGEGAELMIKKYPDDLKEKVFIRFILLVVAKLVKYGIDEMSLVTMKGSRLAELCEITGVYKKVTSEYMMVLDAGVNREPSELKAVFNEIKEDGSTVFEISSPDDDTFTARAYDYKEGKYVFGVEVRADKRRQGFGERYMKDILYRFKDEPVYLQVSGENKAACELYNKLGFEVDKELCYYKI